MFGVPQGCTSGPHLDFCNVTERICKERRKSFEKNTPQIRAIGAPVAGANTE